MHREHFSQVGDQLLWTIAALQDNYIWAFGSPADPDGCWVVDPGEAAPVLAWLNHTKRTLRGILLTHHHPDHIGGVAVLSKYATVILGPSDPRMPKPAQVATEGLHLADIVPGKLITVLSVPGHTSTHVAYVVTSLDAADKAQTPTALSDAWLFCGDTLFASGCGRIFDGTAAQLHDSLQRLLQLPGDTLVCCGHEYTRANIRFALAIEPDNLALHAWQAQVEALLAAGKPTLPTTIAHEAAVNPFLRLRQVAVINAVKECLSDTGLQSDNLDTHSIVDTHSIFAALRKRKDTFKA